MQIYTVKFILFIDSIHSMPVFIFTEAVVVVLLEIFYFNQNGLKYGTYQETYRLDGTDDRVDMQMEEFTSELDEQTAEDLRYQDEMNRLYYELLGAEYESTLDETLTVIDGKTYTNCLLKHLEKQKMKRKKL